MFARKSERLPGILNVIRARLTMPLEGFGGCTGISGA